MSAGFRAGQANDGYLQINGTDILAVSSGVLGVKNTGAQSEVRLYCESNNAHYASLKSPPHSDFIGNVTFTLPGTAGNNGQVLQTDGSGNLSWVNNSGGGGGGGASDKLSEGNTEAEVVDTGSDGHFKVTTEGTERFRISSLGQIQQTNFSGIGLHMSGSGDPTLKISDTDGTNQHVMLAHNGSESYIVTRNDTSHGNFRIYSQNGSETLTRFRIKSDGFVGIGTDSPLAKLHLKDSGTQGVVVERTGSNPSSAALQSDSVGTVIYSQQSYGSSTGVPFRIITGTAERLRVGSAGQIGIGGANYGTAGQVLTSGGASGAVSWTTVSGGGGGYGNSDVDNHLNSGSASSGQILSWNGSDYAWVADQGGSGGGGGLSDLVDDTTPQLGGNLDLNSKNITGTGNINITGNGTFDGNVVLDSANEKRVQYNLSGVEKSKIIFRNTGAIDVYATAGMDFYATGNTSPNNRRIRLLTAGGTQLEYQSSTRLETTSAGVTVTGTLDVSGISTFADELFLSTGSTNILQLETDNLQNSYISQLGTGSLQVQAAGSGILVWANTANGQIILRNGTGVGVVNRLSTTSTGVSVTGTLAATAVTGDGSGLTNLPGISNVVEDTTPQLGGNLDVQANQINTSTSNGNIKLAPNGSGVVEIRGAGGSDGTLQLNCSAQSHGIKLKSPPHSAAASYTLTFPNNIVNGQYLKTDASGNLSWGLGALDQINEGNTTVEVVDTGSDGHIKMTAEGTEALRIDSDGHIRAYGDAGTSSIADAKAAFGTINAVVPSAGGTAALNVLSRGSGTQENIIFRSISTDGWAGAQFRAEDYNFTIRTTNVLTVDFNGSAQFKGKSRPSGLDTRISQYGSLLVGTSGELISNARCAIDSGNGDIKTIGNGEFSINTSTYQTGINLHTSSNLSTLTVYSNNSSTHRSFVVYDNGQSTNANKYRAAIYANGNILTRRLFLGGSTNGGFDYNAIADTLEFLTTNGGTHSELNATAYVPGTNGGKHLGHHNKRWDNVFCNGIRFGGDNTTETTLDDYEEGTWDPIIAQGWNSITYQNQVGWYIKIGNMVTASGSIQFSGTSASNHIQLSIPFAPGGSSDTDARSMGAIYFTNASMTNNNQGLGQGIYAYPTYGSNVRAYLVGNAAPVNATGNATTKWIEYQITYRVS